MEAAVTPPPAAQTASKVRRRLLIGWAIASPLLLLVVTDEWLFTSAGFIDPWHYVGFFLNYSEPRYWDDAYKLARLPWILPGALTYWVAPDSLAPYLLHAGALVALATGFYLLIEELFGSFTIAAIAAMLIGFYTHVHGSGGWDYHNTAAGPYYVWALYILTRAARAPTRRTLFLAGCFTALAVHANITLVNLLPVLAVHWVVLRRSMRPTCPLTLREFGGVMFWVVFGGLAVTGTMMAANVAVGREPLFFNRLIEIVFRYAADPSHQASWWRPWNGGWMRDARHLALGAAVLFAACAMLLYPRSTRRLPAAHRLVLLEFAGLSALWAVWQSAGQTALDWDYFAYPLFPHAVLALTALIHARTPEASGRLVLVTPVLLMIPLAFWFEAHLARVAPAAYAFGSAVPGVTLYAMAIAALWVPQRLRLVVFVLLFAAANGVSAALPSRYAVSNVCRVGPDFHSAIVDANQLVAGLDPRFKDVNLWFQEDETITIGAHCSLRVADFGYALAGSGVPYITTPFPMPSADALPETVLESVARSGIKILLVSGHHQSEAALKRRLDELGIANTVTVRRRLPVLDGAIDVTVVDVRPRTGRDASSPGD